MEQSSQQSSKAYYWIMGILGICFIIVVHEFGHFLAAKIFNVATPIFSIGFGPVLAGFKIGSTEFELAALPLGGYVSIDPASFAAISYFKKIIIMLAGVFFNFLFGAFVVVYLSRFCKPKLEESESTANNRLAQVARQTSQFFSQQTQNSRIIGPIGIISATGKSLQLGFDHFLLALAIISVNIGIFNLLPIPFFDGGQIAMITIETVTGPLAPQTIASINMIFFLFFIALMIYISWRDMRNIKK